MPSPGEGYAREKNAVQRNLRLSPLLLQCFNRRFRAEKSQAADQKNEFVHFYGWLPGVFLPGNSLGGFQVAGGDSYYFMPR